MAQVSDKVMDIVRKNGIKLKEGVAKQTTNLQNNRSKALKEEMRQFVIREATAEEGDENASSGFGTFGKDFLVEKGKKGAKTIFKFSKKLVFLLIKAFLKIAKWLLLSLVSLVSSVTTAMIPILVVLVVIIVFLVAAANSGVRVVSNVKMHTDAIMAEMIAADEVDIHVSGGYYGDRDDITLNQDDMLLILLAKSLEKIGAEKEQFDVPEEEINGRMDAPDLSDYTLDMGLEESVKTAVLDEMLSSVKGSYSYEITVTVTPQPTVASEPVILPAAEGEVSVSPPVPVSDKEQETEESASPAPSVVPMPSPTPVPETETITVTVNTLDVYLRTAENYVEEIGLTKEQREIYQLLLEVFTKDGYLPGNGSTVCDSIIDSFDNE